MFIEDPEKFYPFTNSPPGLGGVRGGHILAKISPNLSPNLFLFFSEQEPNK